MNEKSWTSIEEIQENAMYCALSRFGIIFWTERCKCGEGSKNKSCRSKATNSYGQKSWGAMLTYKKQHMEFIWPHAIKISHLYWLVNHQENRVTSGYKREVQMVIQLQFIKKFAVSVRKNVYHIIKLHGHIEGRKWVLQNWGWKKQNYW